MAVQLTVSDRLAVFGAQIFRNSESCGKLGVEKRLGKAFSSGRSKCGRRAVAPRGFRPRGGGAEAVEAFAGMGKADQLPSGVTLAGSLGEKRRSPSKSLMMPKTGLKVCCRSL